MQVASIRLFTAAVCVAALAACADAPTGTEAAGAGRIVNVSAETRTVPLPAPDQPAQQPGDVQASFQSIPYFCDPDTYHPYCPQIVVGAAVWNQGNSSGGSTASLYAHMDLMENVAESELIVHYYQSAGCYSTPGIYHSDFLYGGSNASAGGPYALVGQRTDTFTGGVSRWQVGAIGRAKGVYGNHVEDSALDAECF